MNFFNKKNKIRMFKMIILLFIQFCIVTMYYKFWYTNIPIDQVAYSVLSYFDIFLYKFCQFLLFSESGLVYFEVLKELKYEKNKTLVDYFLKNSILILIYISIKIFCKYLLAFILIQKLKLKYVKNKKLDIENRKEKIFIVNFFIELIFNIMILVKELLEFLFDFLCFLCEIILFLYIEKDDEVHILNKYIEKERQ